MPEKEISFKEGQAVLRWLDQNGGILIESFSHFPELSGAYKVYGEPLVLRGVERLDLYGR